LGADQAITTVIGSFEEGAADRRWPAQDFDCCFLVISIKAIAPQFSGAKALNINN